MKKIVIDPITRLEGHGRIDIFLNDKDEVENAYLIIPELRGFERFCEGRRAELMPQLTSRICGVCPVAHHMASIKALDSAFNVEPTATAKKIRELMYCAYIIYDHILHFFFLGGPDFVVGPDAPPEKRNIFGVIEKAGIDIAKEVIKHRAFGQKITEIIGGKATHPVIGLPGGITKALLETEKKEIESMLNSCFQFALKTLELFNTIVLGNTNYKDLISSDAFTLTMNDMSLVDPEGYLNFYDGNVRISSPEGERILEFHPSEYLKHIEEMPLETSYVKPTFIKKLGWNGFKEGFDTSLYRVGPLARLNASSGIKTIEASKEYDRFYSFFGKKPVHNTLAFHWARLIELIYATERGLELINDPGITNTDIRNLPNKPGEGIGIVEAARGTLVHHYKLDSKGLVKKVNLIVATTNNYAPIAISVKKAAMNLLKKGSINPATMNMIEMAYRAYDPCFACASHSIGKSRLPQINIFNHKKQKLLKI